MGCEPRVVFIAAAFRRNAEKEKCRQTAELNLDRTQFFKTQMAELGMIAEEAVIVIIKVDDPNGYELVGKLAPEQHWQEFRDQGLIPYVHGLAMRGYIEEALDYFDAEAATKLREMTEVAVVVVDHGVAEVFPA